MKHKILFSFLACTLAGVGAAAQVNIGTLDDPHRAAILHLRTTSEVGKSDSLGMKIPKVALPDTAKLHLGGAETCNLDVDETAAGMLVFNITDDPCGGLTPCLYVWDGASWLVMGCKVPVLACETGIDTETQIPTFTCDACEMQGVEFMRYNLGADPSLDTPKKQMEYLATHSFDKLDAHVYGGLFQWGRKDLDYAVDTETFQRYDDNSLSYDSWNKQIDAITHQPTGDAKGKFIYTNNTNEENWYPNAKNTHTVNDTLWGNGVEVGSFVDKNGSPFTSGVYLTATENYYQQRVKTINDPCPEGWRVPTQDEFEMLINYNCSPSTAVDGGLPIGENQRYVTTGHGLTWVKVDKNGKSTKTLNTNAYCGYAVYATAAWDNAADNYKDGTLALYTEDAPYPILFFPIAWYRSAFNGMVDADLVRGVYASSTIKGYKIHFLSLTNTWINAFSTENEYRAHGYSIRCCKTVER